MIYWLGWFLSLVWLRVCYRLRRVGSGQIPPRGGLLVVANHASFLDPLAIGCTTRRRLTFVARGTLHESRLYSLLTRTLDVVHLDPSRGDRAALRVLRDAVAAGQACVVFPEGTRSRDGSLGPLKGGALLVARQAGVPVVPAWIDGTYDIWPRGRRWPRAAGRIRVVIGEPMLLAGDREESMERLRARLLELAPRTVAERERVPAAAAATDAGSAAQGCGSITERAPVVGAEPVR